MRPWLVIIEVNMTDSSLNTECTGTADMMTVYVVCGLYLWCSGAVLSPWWVVSSRSCACGDKWVPASGH